jgi:Ca2+-dependent lipid-binding protein
MGVLVVLLEKVTNLRDSDGFGKSDPYVKFELMKDNFVFDKNYGKKESSKKAGVLNPEYNETFEFPDLPSLNNMILKIRIMDSDVGLDDAIGSTEIKLERLGLNETPRAVEEIVEKAKGAGFTCSPTKLLCYCCCALLNPKRSAKIYLKLSYRP